jgi:hypothetical protein
VRTSNGSILCGCGDRTGNNEVTDG